ncbi:hypothetical protein [Maricaulis parjimensis]|uniref:hypothetical protein n=1 Tax=Maricaulis parjimensis TaxID=144023 RepID=UPI001939FE4C|nr:hypothetical protein [Maricaulis parjimensis]
MLIIIEMMLIGCMFLGLRAPIPAFGLSGVLVVVASLVMFAMGFERYGMLNGFALSLLALAIPMLGSAWRGRDSLVKRGAK